ncbi:hypothetical protein KFK09_011606 [Dendrobium nobile]|uniref:Protein kinase domain-containing protein n=1 Tax=Dendrobium nobile TaxID=94219 RepID=A0A8T3BFD0_DENNO|nr:hypothetical protein KFK09_011606 [Dendrobium nobile]
MEQVAFLLGLAHLLGLDLLVGLDLLLGLAHLVHWGCGTEVLQQKNLNVVAEEIGGGLAEEVGYDGEIEGYDGEIGEIGGGLAEGMSNLPSKVITDCSKRRNIASIGVSSFNTTDGLLGAIKEESMQNEDLRKIREDLMKDNSSHSGYYLEGRGGCIKEGHCSQEKHRLQFIDRRASRGGEPEFGNIFEEEQKLAMRYFGPCEVVDKIGAVAYRLKLPPTAILHPVFHVLQLRRSLGEHAVSAELPDILTEELEVILKPLELGGVIVDKKGNKEVLIRWNDILEFEATWEPTWEPYDRVRLLFPSFHLEDKCFYLPEHQIESGSRSTRAKPLHWTSCLKIAEDVAQGLAYIHQASRLVHGNIRSSNVLLGSDFEACLTDNCLSFLVDPVDPENDSGYRAPETRKSNRHLTPLSDIYAFGVLLLELLTGKPPLQHHFLVATDLPTWVRSVRDDEGADDERLRMIVDVTAACVRSSPESRPTTWQVLKMIQEVKEADIGEDDDKDLGIS